MPRIYHSASKTPVTDRIFKLTPLPKFIRFTEFLFHLGKNSNIFHKKYMLTIFVFFPGFARYLNMVHEVSMTEDHSVHCTAATTILFMSSICSTLFILTMTFERFFSIVKPHKAASVNTTKRAKIAVACIIMLSILYNIPHIFITRDQQLQCIQYGKVMDKTYGQFYYWFTIVINYFLPFVLLLSMNSVIIHTLRTRSHLNLTGYKSQGQNEGQTSKMKSSETQIYIMLLLVSFAFLLFTTPGYALIFYINFVNFLSSANSYAGYYLFYNVAQKLNYTNHGINFFLYVMSGHKFRNDLVKLFSRNRD